VHELEARGVAVLEVLELSRNRIEVVVRFPCTTVKRLAGSTSSAVAAIERMGVMPLPAAIAT
jgi:hypothetical protein